MIGMIMSDTREETIFPNAPPITTPTARSATFHCIANSRNSCMTLIKNSYSTIDYNYFFSHFNMIFYSCFMNTSGGSRMSRESASMMSGAV